MPYTCTYVPFCLSFSTHLWTFVIFPFIRQAYYQVFFSRRGEKTREFSPRRASFPSQFPPQHDMYLSWRENKAPTLSRAREKLGNFSHATDVSCWKNASMIPQKLSLCKFDLSRFPSFQIACYDTRPDIPASLSPELRDLAARCLQRRPNLRPTARELLEHPVYSDQ